MGGGKKRARAHFLLLLSAVLLLACAVRGDEGAPEGVEVAKPTEEVKEEPVPPKECDFLEKLDLYERLGVDKQADDKALKRAYRKLSLQYHPDKNKGAEKDCAQKHFIAIAKAYEILSDEEKRKKYDIFGMEDEGNGDQGFDPFGGSGMDPFSLFQHLFERQGGSNPFGGGGRFGSGPFGGGQQMFFFDEEPDGQSGFDMNDCVNYCIINYRQSGYGGDLEGVCIEECEQQAQQEQMFGGGQFGGGGPQIIFEQGAGPFGGPFGGGSQMFFEDGEGQEFFHDDGGQFFQQGGGNPFMGQQQHGDPRANILEFMMNQGGPVGGGGGFHQGGGFQGMHGSQRVLVEDEHGNQFWQEMDGGDGMFYQDGGMDEEYYDPYEHHDPRGGRRGGGRGGRGRR